MAQVADNSTGRRPKTERKARDKTPAKATTKSTTKRGRRKTARATSASAKAAGAETQKRRDLRDKVRAMRAELSSTVQQHRAAVKREKANTEALKSDLKAALKREQALMKLIDARDEAARNFADRWTKEKIAQIQKPRKKYKRRKTATHASATQ